MSHANRSSTFRAVVLCLALAALCCFALEVRTTAQNQPARKRPQAQSGDKAAAAKTSRVTVTSDAPLNDYSARSEGNRFYVDVPASSAPRVGRGGGAKNVRVLRRGDRTVLEFTLPPGTTARVNQKFNKLDVIIQQAAAAPAGSLASPNTAAPIVATAPAASAPRNASPSPRPTPQASPANANNANPPRNTAAAPTNALPALDRASTEQNRADSTTLAPATGDERSGANPVDDSAANADAASNQTAPAQTPPANAAPAANVESAPLSNNSNGARLVRNWPLVFLAALLLAVVVWFIASRLKTATPRDAASPSPSRVDDGRVGARTSPVGVAVEPVTVERGRAQTVSTNGNSGQSKPDETASRKTARAAATPKPAAIEQERPAKSTPVKTSSEAETSTVAETSASATTTASAETLASAAATAKPESASGLPAAIEASLGSGEASERAEAVAQLVFLGSEAALKRIGEAFADPAPQVRDAAARALFKFNKDYVASFSRLMRESKPEVRAHIAASIASSGLAAEAIGSLNGGTEREIYESFSLLFLMAKAGEIKTLVRAIESHPKLEVRLAVIKLLSMSELPSVVAAFTRLQTDPALPARARTALAEALSQMSGK